MSVPESLILKQEKKQMNQQALAPVQEKENQNLLNTPLTATEVMAMEGLDLEIQKNASVINQYLIANANTIEVNPAVQQNIQGYKTIEQTGSDKERKQATTQRLKLEGKVAAVTHQAREKKEKRLNALDLVAQQVEKAGEIPEAFKLKQDYANITQGLTFLALKEGDITEAQRFDLFERCRYLQTSGRMLQEKYAQALYSKEVLQPRLAAAGKLTEEMRLHIEQRYQIVTEGQKNLSEKIMNLKIEMLGQGLIQGRGKTEEKGLYQQRVDETLLEHGRRYRAEVSRMASIWKLPLDQAEIEYNKVRLRSRRPKTLQKIEEKINRFAAGKDDHDTSYGSNYENYKKETEAMMPEVMRQLEKKERLRQGNPKLVLPPIPLSVMEEDAAELLKDLMENSNFCMRRGNLDTLKKIVDGGRFVTQMETGTSGGANNQKLRKYYSAKKFGTDTGTATNRDYEKYGYLGTQDIQHQARSKASQYGDVLFNYRKSALQDRTTMTLGDSLDSRETTQPTRVTSPKLCSVSGSSRVGFMVAAHEYCSSKMKGGAKPPDIEELLSQASIQEASYLELQYHGELTLNEVESVTIFLGRAKGINPASLKAHIKTIQQLQKMHIQVKANYVDKTDPKGGIVEKVL